MSNWLIRDAAMVNEGRRMRGDLRVRDGRIEAIGGTLAARPGEREFDARGRLLIPGMIDDQVHFREPGLEHKADIATESRAAVAGGITSYMEMPNTRPPAVTLEAVKDKYARAARRSLANHAFYLGATNDNLEELKRATPADACGIKVFMGASTGNMLVDDPATLEAIFAQAPLLLITHCEDTPMIDAALAIERAHYGDGLNARRHPYIRSREACLKSSTFAVALARRHDARLHVLHVSTADEMALFEPGPITAKRVTAETCVHFLRFDEGDYPVLGNRLKCNPSVKGEGDRVALTRALAEGRIDILATDHAPHTREEKALPYEQAPSGLPLVQDCLQAAIECVREGTLTLEQLVQRACHSPAELFGVQERGYLREGYWADLTLIDLDRPETRTPEQVLSKCAWSPFEGMRFGSTIAATFVNGHLAWHDGRLDDSVLGMPLDCRRGRV